MTNIRRKATIIILSVTLGVPLGYFGGNALTDLHEQRYQVPADVHTTPIELDTFTVASHGARSKRVTLPACKLEDSDNCIWDAGKRGNGEGVSFIAYRGRVYYLDASMDR